MSRLLELARLVALARLAALAAAVIPDDTSLFQSRVHTFGKRTDVSPAGGTDATERAAVVHGNVPSKKAGLIDAGTLWSHPVRDNGAMHLAAVSCFRCMRLSGMVWTLLAQAKLEGGRRPVLHYFVDSPCAQRMRGFDERALKSIDLRLYDIKTAIKKVSPSITWNETIGKPCSVARLYLPRLFPKLRKLLYLDDDTIVLNSLRPIYELAVPAFAMAEDISTPPQAHAHYCPHWQNGTLHLINNSEGHMSCFHGNYGTNAGVLLLNLEGWRQMGLDADVDLWMGRLTSGEWVAPYFEQSILNVMSLERPESAALLPCEANVHFTTRWMCFFHEGSWKAFNAWKAFDALNKVLNNVTEGQVLRRNSRRPILLHSKFGDGTIAQEWRFLRQQALHFANLVQSEGLRNASSLCDVFNCDRYLLEDKWTCPCFRGIDNCDCVERDYFVESTTYPHTY